MRFLFGLALACSAILAPPVAAENHIETSWGKAGVPLDRYAQDAAECTETSRYVMAYIKPETLRELDTLSSAQLLDTVIQIGSSAPMNVVQAIIKLRSADDIARRSNTFGAKYVAMVSLDVRDQLQAVIDRCLIERGYVQIHLTDDQANALRRFKRHSPERVAYLHSIDADPAIITRQRVETGNQ